jgi:predicted tellurium resistance membrane protein TerC
MWKMSMKKNQPSIRAACFFLLAAIGGWLVFSGYSDPTVYNKNIYGWLAIFGFLLFVAGVVGLLLQMISVFPKKDI